MNYDPVKVSLFLTLEKKEFASHLPIFKVFANHVEVNVAFRKESKDDSAEKDSRLESKKEEEELKKPQPSKSDLNTSEGDLKWSENLFSTIQNNIELQMDNLIIKWEEFENNTKLSILCNSILLHSVDAEFNEKAFVVSIILFNHS